MAIPAELNRTMQEGAMRRRANALAPTEYIAVSDKTSEVLLSSEDRYEVIKFVNRVRKAGGEVTVFKSTKL